MGISFTIGGVAFAQLQSTGGARQALGFDADSPAHDIIRYHPKGVTGNYLTRGGKTTTLIRLRIRYVSATPYAWFEADKAAWANTAVAIVGPEAESFTRCSLVPGSMRIVREPQGWKSHGSFGAFMDVEAVFLSDA